MQPRLFDTAPQVRKNFAIYILDCLRLKQKPTIAGHHVSSSYLTAAVRNFADHGFDLHLILEKPGRMSRPEMRALARTFEVVDYPDLDRKEWIHVAASILLYERWLEKEEKRLDEIAKREREALLSEVGYEIDSQLEFGLTKPV